MKGSKKVEGGKLVKVDLDYTDKIEQLKIHGDFFIEPPEALEQIEEKITGLEMNEDEIIKKITEVNAELIGFSAEDIADALTDAAGEKK